MVAAVIGLIVWARAANAKQLAALSQQQEAERAKQETERAAAHEAWLAAPAEPLILPSRFTDRWFEENVPTLHPGQVEPLLTELRARGWTEPRIEQRVGPWLKMNPHA